MLLGVLSAEKLCLDIGGLCAPDGCITKAIMTQNDLPCKLYGLGFHVNVYCC